MSSFGGTVKLTGESEYRKALSEISSNLKVLNSEMKAVTSQYDKNDKSVENLSSQNEVLNKKIEEQEKKVGILKDALAKSKEETGENSEATKKWQTELNNAQADLNKMNRQVETNADVMKEAEGEIKKGADAVEEFGEEAEKSGEKALSFGDIIKSQVIAEAVISGLKALADGIASAGNAMKEALVNGAAYADTLLTLSAQTGLSTDTLEKYNAVAELTDVSLDTLTGSMAKNVKAMGEAQKGGKKYIEAYEKLGVTVTDANGNLRDSESVYWETVDALKGIENETERDALAMELFGKKAQDLNTIIEMGSEGVAEYSQKAVEMGAVLGGEGLSALGALDDQMQIFTSTTEATKNILASAFAPAVSGVLEGVNELGGAFNGLVAAVISGEGVDKAFDNVSLALTGLVSGLEQAVPQVLGIVGDLFSMVLDLVVEYAPYLIEQGASMLTSMMSGISQSLGKIFPVVLSVVQTVTETILTNLPMVLQMGIQVVVSLIQGISSMLPDLIPLCIDTVVMLTETILDNLDLVIDAGVSLIVSLATGLVDSTPKLLDKIPVIIDKTVLAITNNLPKLLSAGVTLTVKLTEGLLQSTPLLLEQLPILIGKLTNALIVCLPDVVKCGYDLLVGLTKGLLNPSVIWSTARSLFNGIIGSIKSVFGIHSPSTVFRDIVGQNLALGLGEGFTITMEDVTDDMTNAIPTEFDADINTNMNVASGNTQLSTYDMMVSAFKQALTEVKVVMDDREMGGFVTDTVERVVFA